MSIEENLRILSDRIRTHAATMVTEEAVKTAVVLPFFNALGYDIFNPSEVIPEFTADAMGKKGEKVDYAVCIDNQVRILIECKPITCKLDKVHLAQLFRYFTVTDAKFAILTNGRDFHFHTDLEEPNKLDKRPFLTFDLSDLQPHLLNELQKFQKNEFDVEGILASAERLKYTSAIKASLQAMMEEPPEDLVRAVAGQIYEGRFTGGVKERFTLYVKSAFRDLIRDAVKSRISNALADTEQHGSDEAIPAPQEIETTEEEIEGFMIVRAITRQVLPSSRVTMRDAKSYCAILVDDNNRKPLTRLHLNRSTKYVGLFDGDTEDKVQIAGLDDLYELADRLLATAEKYV